MNYHFEIKAGKRGGAGSYISYITRQGRYQTRNDLVDSGHGNMPPWTEEKPEAFWLAADEHERKNAAPFRAYTISLPNVLTVEQNKPLAWEIVHALAGSKPFQLAVHAPYSSLEGEWNPHVHAVISDRVPDGIERPPEQVFRRYNAKEPARGGCRKDSGGKPPLELRNHVIEQRKMVADITNAALARHGHSGRVDHRTLKQQGKLRDPETYLGPGRIRKMTAKQRDEHIAGRKARRADA